MPTPAKHTHHGITLAQPPSSLPWRGEDQGSSSDLAFRKGPRPKEGQGLSLKNSERLEERKAPVSRQGLGRGGTVRPWIPSYKPASPPSVRRLGPPSSRAPRPSWPSVTPLQGVPTPRRVPRPPQLLARALLAVCPASERRPAPEAVCPAPPRSEPRPLRGVRAPCRLAVHVGAVAWDNQDLNRPMTERSGRGGGTRGASALPSPDYYEQVAHLQQGLRNRYGLAGAGAGSRPARGSTGAPPPTTVPLGWSPDQPCPPNSRRTEFTGDTALHPPVGGPRRECPWMRPGVKAGVSCLSLLIKACEFLWSPSTLPSPALQVVITP